MKKLSILIPHYDEDKEYLYRILDSIKIQQGVDLSEIQVVVASDGYENHYEPYYDEPEYPFDIKYTYLSEHKGVSATRNEALRCAEGEYVMFCDIDDMFASVCALFIIFNEIEKGFDVLISYFLEESKPTNFLLHQLDYTFVHGKVYRRKYLLNNNIYWNPNLTIHEDSYFNSLAINLADPDRVKVCTTPFYLWKWRDASVCRHDPKYILKTYNNMLDSSTALVREFTDRNKMQNAQNTVCNMIFDAYYTMNKEEWLNQENKEYRQNTEDRFKKYYIDFYDLFHTIDQNTKNGIIAGCKNRKMLEGVFLEEVTFKDWIKMIMEG